MPLSSVAWKFQVGEDGNGIALDTSHPIGLDRFARKSLRKLTGDTPLERCLRDIGQIMRQDFRRAFAEGGPGWTPLAAATVRQKERQGFPRKGKNGRTLRRLRQVNAAGANAVLIRSGELRDSYGVKNAPGHVEEVDIKEGTVRVGSALPYAGAHQGGALLRRKQAKQESSKLPALARVLRSMKLGRRRAISTKTGLGILPSRPVLVSPAAHQLIKARIEQYLAEIATTIQ